VFVRGAIAPAKLKEFDGDTVRSRYIEPDFVPSLTLEDIGAVLK
jgi:hypothetical protein